MAGQFQDGSASLVGSAHLIARPSVTLEWDYFTSLVLSIISAGSVPLAVTSGIAVGAIARGSVPVWGVVAIGVAGGVVAFALNLGVLCGLTRGVGRQPLIQFSRWLLGFAPGPPAPGA